MPLPQVQPIIPTSRKEPFDAPGWLFEFKYDGFRALCHLERGRRRLVSRRGNILDRFGALCDQLAAELDVDKAILDGEVIAADETGRPRFYDLLRRAKTPSYVAFDLLWLERCRPSLPASQRAPASPTERFTETIVADFRGPCGRGQGTRALRAHVRARPRGYCRQAPGRTLRAAHEVAQDQEP
jgi:ATP dependent DNA ligase domain